MRAYEHLGVSINTDNVLAYNENAATAVHKHCHDLGHTSSIDHFNVIGHASNKYHLLLKEARGDKTIHHQRTEVFSTLALVWKMTLGEVVLDISFVDICFHFILFQ